VSVFSVEVLSFFFQNSKKGSKRTMMMSAATTQQHTKNDRSQQKRKKIRMEMFRDFDPRRVMETGDVEMLQLLLEELVQGDVEERTLKGREDAYRYADERHVFKLLQNALKYTLHAQEMALEDLARMDKRLTLTRSKFKEARNEAIETEHQIGHLSNVCKIRRRLVSTYECLLRQQRVQVGKGTITHSGQSKVQTCKICGKMFESDEYLQSHIVRRHPGEMNDKKETKKQEQHQQLSKDLILSEVRKMIEDNEKRVTSTLREAVDRIEVQNKKKKKRYHDDNDDDDDAIEVDGLRLRRRAQSESSRHITQQIEQMRQERARAEKMMQVRMHHFEIDLAREYAQRYGSRSSNNNNEKSSVSTSMTGLPKFKGVGTNTSLGDLEEDNGRNDVLQESLSHEMADRNIW